MICRTKKIICRTFRIYSFFCPTGYWKYLSAPILSVWMKEKEGMKVKDEGRGGDEEGMNAKDEGRGGDEDER
jgi:hypothetical protein